MDFIVDTKNTLQSIIKMIEYINMVEHKARETYEKVITKAKFVSP